MFRRFVAPLLFGLVLATWAGAQAPAPVLDPSVRTGTLANGVKYFLQHNPKPENRAELRLVIRAGSIQETEKERGLAHLVEHLQFEGTERFEAQEIVSFLESNGMKFGGDLNAHTSFTETQYFLEVPVDQPAVMAKGLMILEDWAHGPKVLPELLEKEKKIVAEEERVRMENVQGRMTNFYLPKLLAGTVYADRMPIGKMDVLAAVTPADVQRFVSRWYQPSAMAVVIVGAIDPVAMEAQLKASFTRPFPARLGAPAPDAPSVPPYQADGTHSFSDPDLGGSVLVWNRVDRANSRDLKAIHAREVLNFVLSSTLSKRFTDLTQNADPPFLQAGIDSSPFFGDSTLTQFQVVLRDGMADRSLTTFLTEVRRAALYGVTASDLQLALTEYRSRLDAAWAQRDNTTNTDRADSIASFFLTGDPAPDDALDYASKKAAADALTLEAVNAAAPAWLATSPTQVLVLTNGQGGPAPTEAQIREVAARVAATNLDKADERTIKPLFVQEPKPGRIVKTEAIAGTPLTRWTLSNGLVLYLHKNAFTKNEVVLRGQTPGGLSLVNDQDVLSAAFAPYLFANTGVGDLSLAELNDALTGHQVGTSFWVDDTSAAFAAQAVPADLKELFQLVNRKLGPVRRDPAAEASFLKQVEESTRNTQDLPNQHFQNEIQRLLTNGAPRGRPLTVERLAEVNADRAAALYQQLFRPSTRWTLTLSGDFDEAALKPLVETYLASLPVATTPVAKDLAIRPTKGPVTSVIQKGPDDKAVVVLMVPVALPYSAKAAFTAGALQEILDIRLREVVRQDKEGTYGVGVDITLEPLPYPHAVTQVSFTCDRPRQDELIAAVKAELLALSKGTISDEVFTKAIEIRNRGLETSQKTNAWWSTAVTVSLHRGDDVKLLPTLPAFYGALKKAEVIAQAKALLDPSKALVVVLNPEAKP